MKNQPIPDMPAREAPDREWSDVGPVLDAEIGQLPEKLRAALVLCELQGLDRAAAAERLGVPVGTVSSRLSRAKDALRRRLVRRGITLSLAALALVLTQAARAAVPPPLVRQTAAAATRFAVGSGVGAPAALATRVMRPPARRAVLIGSVGGLLGLAVGTAPLGGIRPRAGGGRPGSDSGDVGIHVVRFAGKDVPEMFGPTATIDGRCFGPVRRHVHDRPGHDPKVDRPGGAFGMRRQADVMKGVYELAEDHLRIHLASLVGSAEDHPARDGEETMLLILETGPRMTPAARAATFSVPPGPANCAHHEGVLSSRGPGMATAPLNRILGHLRHRRRCPTATCSRTFLATRDSAVFASHRPPARPDRSRRLPPGAATRSRMSRTRSRQRFSSCSEARGRSERVSRSGVGCSAWPIAFRSTRDAGGRNVKAASEPTKSPHTRPATPPTFPGEKPARSCTRS